MFEILIIENHSERAERLEDVEISRFVIVKGTKINTNSSTWRIRFHYITHTYTHKHAATYLNLDEDHNGMLSKKEFKGYGGGTLTNVFVDRIFQEYRMYDREMVCIYV